MTQLYLIAEIAGRGVAIPSNQIESVIEVSDIVAVPRADPAVRGLLPLRSRVVTVIDTSVALGLAESAGGQRRAIITVVDGHYYAILVDNLKDIVPLIMQPVPLGLTPRDGWARCATGIVEHDDEPILTIDLPALLPVQSAAA